MSIHTDQSTPGVPPTIAVVGGGTMGVGIAYVYAAAGWTTWVVEPDETRAHAMLQTIGQTAASGVRRGKLKAEQAAQMPHVVQRVASVAELPMGLDLVVETVPERLALKQQVLTGIEQRSPRVIASNTSALSIDVLAGSLKDPGLFLGMHFFNPVWSLPMVELVRGSLTRPDILLLARSFAEAGPIKMGAMSSIADSLCAPHTEAYSYGLCRRAITDLVTINDADLRAAMHLLFEELKLAVEPACAAATAAACGPLRARLAGKRVGVLLCGSNTDLATFTRHMGAA